MKQFWFEILAAISEGPCHGAEIRRRISMTGAERELYPAMLYGSLEELLDKQWIAEVEPDGRKRRYQLTESGRMAALEETRRLEGIAVRVRKTLENAS